MPRLRVLPLFCRLDGIPDQLGVACPMWRSLRHQSQGGDDFFAELPASKVMDDSSACVDQSKSKAVSDASQGRMAFASGVGLKVRAGRASLFILGSSQGPCGPGGRRALEQSSEGARSPALLFHPNRP